MPMLPHIPIIPGETILSWADRSAQAQAGHCLPELLRVVGFPQKDVEPVKDLAVLARLTDLFGGEAPALEASAIFRHDGNMRRFRHEVFKPSMLCRRVTAFCPMCLLDDGSFQHSRVSWQFSSTVCCDRHDIALTTTKAEIHFDALVPSVAFPDPAALQELCDAATPMTPGPLQRYVEDRLSGSTCEPLWPDGCRLDQVMGISRCLGNAMRDHTTGDLGDACRTGFEALRGGKASILKALDDILCQRGQKARVNTPTRALGRLYDAVRLNEDLSPLRPLVRSFLLDNVPLAAGDDIFGEVVPARRRHDLATLSGMCGMSKLQVRDVFAALGLLSTDNGRPLNALTFDAVESETVACELRGSVPANALSAHLGCDMTTAAAVLNAGLVERVLGDRIIVDRDADALKRVSLDSIHVLLALLFENATTIAVVPVQFATLSAAARHAHWQVDRIIRLVLSGRLDLYGLVGRTDFDGLLIDEPQLLRILEAPPMTAAMSKEDAANELGVEVQILENIMRIPDESGAPIIRRVVPLTGPLKRRHQVAKPDFEQFRLDHISIRELAEAEGATLAEMHASLQKRGILPILSGMLLATQVFRRSDI
ncbi:conserved hypothetical protein (plasmid) [Ketogulonicigenium vulgare Y25]|uniref:TniQ domain-containing protein n=1 Tax=Ketogulonicigenium vulgare (strain WSH-001) TaxID=759362 RepID=F9YBM0_KETVW|nr:TniQ family protein [Ketogulonicigenium vulgare]ADO44339.1 conserved hypothetical protein [Ketogulonicigenium vulgare Y25]AEM42772.1 hypothetical protein KVU_PB0094 [Ketogulonicigenium vulgare WSH-001]ALJ82788.1 hypothetical protein KVH_15900 [Ketogulonicigenium vulgare]